MEFPAQEIGWQVAAGLFKRGVLVAGTYSKAQVIRIEPALGIPMELLQEMLEPAGGHVQGGGAGTVARERRATAAVAARPDTAASGGGGSWRSRQGVEFKSS